MRGRVIELELENPTDALAFQVSAAVRTKTGGLIAPVIGQITGSSSRQEKSAC